MNLYSLTVRPRHFNPEWRERLIDEFSRKFYGDYIIALEKGNSDEYNHLQVGVETSTRSNNLNRRIKKILDYEPEDDSEEGVWFKLKSHQDKHYLFGYCAKEGDYKTNSKNIQEHIEQYKTRKEKLENLSLNKSFVIKSLNQIFPGVLKFAEQNNLEKNSFHKLAKTMFIIQAVPFTIWSKIRTKDFEEEWKLYIAYKLSNLEIEQIFDKLEECSRDRNGL